MLSLAQFSFMQVQTDTIAKALMLEAVINARIERASEDKDYYSFGKTLDSRFDAQWKLKKSLGWK
jgi:hypothetical protein